MKNRVCHPNSPDEVIAKRFDDQIERAWAEHEYRRQHGQSGAPQTP